MLREIQDHVRKFETRYHDATGSRLKWSMFKRFSVLQCYPAPLWKITASLTCLVHITLLECGWYDVLLQVPSAHTSTLWRITWGRGESKSWRYWRVRMSRYSLWLSSLDSAVQTSRAQSMRPGRPTAYRGDDATLCHIRDTHGVRLYENILCLKCSNDEVMIRSHDTKSWYEVMIWSDSQDNLININ